MFRLFILGVIVSLFFVVYEDAKIAGTKYAESTRVTEFFEYNENQTRHDGKSDQLKTKAFPLHVRNSARKSGGGKSTGGRGSLARR